MRNDADVMQLVTEVDRLVKRGKRDCAAIIELREKLKAANRKIMEFEQLVETLQAIKRKCIRLDDLQAMGLRLTVTVGEYDSEADLVTMDDGRVFAEKTVSVETDIRQALTDFIELIDKTGRNCEFLDCTEVLIPNGLITRMKALLKEEK